MIAWKLTAVVVLIAKGLGNVKGQASRTVPTQMEALNLGSV